MVKVGKGKLQERAMECIHEGNRVNDVETALREKESGNHGVPGRKVATRMIRPLGFMA